MCELNKTKNFYTLMCLVGFLIILLPVGIANLIFDYTLKDSPRTLCWGQREAMIFIGVIALFIVRYRLRGKYLAALLTMTAFGLYQSFAHSGNHAYRDLDQGFGLAVFGIRIYFWAEVVFWAAVFILGVIFAFAPKFSAFETEMVGEEFRQWTKFSFVAVLINTFIVTSNVFQAFVSTGVPPYVGQGDPVRFSLNPKYIIWSDKGWSGLWQNLSFLGKRDVKAPDHAFESVSEKLGIVFDNGSQNVPSAKIDENLQITDEQNISFNKPINTLDFIGGEFVASSKLDVAFMDENFNIKSAFELNPYFSATIDSIIGIIPYMQDEFSLMGSNEFFLGFGRNENADEVLQYADFIKGADKFEGQGKDLGHGRLDIVRAKFHHVASMTNDANYLYLATVSNNKNTKDFIISKASLKDRVLSGELSPKAALKEDKTLGNLYMTSTVFKDGKTYALSKNHNVIVITDIAKEEVVKVISYPSEIKNARSLFFKDNKIYILSCQDGSNKLYTLK